ncbi:MAG: DUF2796 domain-containing protein [Rubrivivax sp.]|nr:DUF2796 domain-containing protein [Rubrivivax sp.]MDP3610865.1 DUF2796 domain-containing protein [Rubrivivax sp.]
MHTSATWLMSLMLSLSTQVAAQHKHSHAHEHGVVRLDVAVQGESLTVNLDAPLDSLVGFERAPRNDKERQAADEVLARLKSGAGLFNGDASAQCTLSKAEVKAPVLEAGATAKGGHADLEASYEFRCTLPAQLRTLDLGLFEAFKRIQRIDVQVAGARGQVKVTLRRPARSVRLVR